MSGPLTARVRAPLAALERACLTAPAAAALVTLALAAGCSAPEAGFQFSPPGRLRHALTGVPTLSATAEVFDVSGEQAAESSLTVGADGASFSGFIETVPGDYHLEIVFRGVPEGESAEVFLGRYRSDAFSVSLGTTVTPTFNTPIDPFGRPADEGDLDGDGLANLDEILFSTDLRMADSDGDGIIDARDCFPADGARAIEVLPGGNLLDCDGDGSDRPDRPYGEAGQDCNDADPSVNPRAADDCSDAIDQDCNPATCPVDDMERPVISDVEPISGAQAGCHTLIRARITDAGGVSRAAVIIDPDGEEIRIPMVASGIDEWVSGPINLFGGFDNGDGLKAIVIEAFDNNQNEARLDHQLDYRLAPPTIDMITPREGGEVSAPFALSAQASSEAGPIAALSLWLAPHLSGTMYDVARATELAAESGPSLNTTVDPSLLEDGTYVLYLIAVDAVGNVLQPSGGTVFSPVEGTVLGTDYICRQDLGFPTTPALVISVGDQSVYSPAMMQELLPEALSLANAANPSALMVSAIGFGVRPDGTVGLDDASSFQKRWQFGFYDAGADTALTVTWYTPAFGFDPPVVELDAGNVTQTDPIPTPLSLVGSDAAVGAHDAAGCPALTGDDDDFILYQMSGGEPRVFVNDWIGTAVSPIMERNPCP